MVNEEHRGVVQLAKVARTLGTENGTAIPGKQVGKQQ